MKDGGPAYPAHDYICGDLSADGFAKLGETRGMSLRDWFAGMAIVSIPLVPNQPKSVEQAAEWAYQQADAMLAERSKP
jgi:hypothetical protein